MLDTRIMPFNFFFDPLVMNTETQWQPVLDSLKKLDSQRACIRLKPCA